MPEGDTLHRTATVLRAALLGQRVVTARGRPGGAHLERVIGATVDRVDAVGKHLLIGFDLGLTLHTHLRMHGSWHRYRPGERWRVSDSRAVAVIETPTTVAVCFDAPTVELIDTRALPLHPVLARLGPDLLAPEPEMATAVARLLDPSRASMTVAEALLDQTAAAGIGNVYRSEVLFIDRVDPFTRVTDVGPDVLERLLRTGATLMRANVGGGARVTMPDASGGQPGAFPGGRRSERLWVYGRAGRPCRRCGTPITSRMIGTTLPRRLYWCPTCQG